MELNNHLQNRKKIIILGILAILVLAVGISYAFFEANITGNKEVKDTYTEASIRALQLTGTTEIALQDGYPGVSRSMTFTVKNTGTKDLQYSLDMIEVTNNFENPSDLVYTITGDNGVNISQTAAPLKDALLKNEIPITAGATHNYTLTLTFLKTEDDQNDNMYKHFGGRIQINNLKNRLLANTLFIEGEVDFQVGEPPETEPEGGTLGSGILTAEDDLGTSYVFRGDKSKLKNNIILGDLTGRVVRINGDGTIRIILSKAVKNFVYNLGQDSNILGQSAGYTYSNGQTCKKDSPCRTTYSDGKFTNEFVSSDSNAKILLENYYTQYLAEYDKYIDYGLYCNDTSYIGQSSETSPVYGPNLRHKGVGVTLKCPDPVAKGGGYQTYGGLYQLKIGMISLDEANMAGIGGGTSNSLDTQYFSVDGVSNIMTMSPDYGYTNRYEAILYYIGSFHRFIDVSTGYSLSTSPIINLKATVSLGDGDGSIENPFVVS